MLRGLPLSRTAKLSEVRFEIGRLVFLSLTSASRNTTRVLILIVSSASCAVAGNDAKSMTSSKKYLDITLLLIVNRCFVGDGLARAFRIFQQQRQVLCRERRLDHCRIAFLDRDYQHVVFVACISKIDVILFRTLA